MSNILTIEERKRRALAVRSAVMEGRVEPFKAAIESFTGMSMAVVNKWLYDQIHEVFIPTPGFNRDKGQVLVSQLDMDDEDAYTRWHKGMSVSGMQSMHRALISASEQVRIGKMDQVVARQLYHDCRSELYEIQEVTGQIETKLLGAETELKHLPSPGESA